MAIPTHHGQANANAILIAPDPVPNSAKRNFFDFFSKSLKTISTIISVSDLGISTLSVTVNFKSLQKANPQRYCMGVKPIKCSSHIDSRKSKFFLDIVYHHDLKSKSL